MVLPLLGILAGVLLGLFLPVQIPPTWSAYMAIVILSAIDAVFGGLRATSDGEFQTDLFISGLLGNTALAIGLTYLGDHLDVPVYLVAIFAFGMRIFHNFALLRRHLLTAMRSRRKPPAP